MKFGCILLHMYKLCTRKPRALQLGTIKIYNAAADDAAVKTKGPLAKSEGLHFLAGNYSRRLSHVHHDAARSISSEQCQLLQTRKFQIKNPCKNSMS